MNGHVKFHSPDGPAFNKGEVWRSASGSMATIESTRRYGPDKWDVDVTYSFSDGPITSKTRGAFRFATSTALIFTCDFVIRKLKNIPK